MPYWGVRGGDYKGGVFYPQGRPLYAQGYSQGKTAMFTVLSYVPDAIAVIVAAIAYVVARSRGPTAWAKRVSSVELALADLEERHEATRAQLSKWRGRLAAREKRADDNGHDQVETEGEPDPTREPLRWKEWVNNGGITRLRNRK